MSELICYLCVNEQCDDEQKTYCTIGSNHNCYQSAVFENGRIVYRRGCYETDLKCPTIHPRKNAFFECCQTNYCNDKPFPILKLHQKSSIEPPIAIIGFFAFMSFLFLSFLFLYYYKKTFTKSHHYSQTELERIEKEHINIDDQQYTTPSNNLQSQDGFDGSGSGSGYPLLVQRTFSKQIELKECIGKGRYGEVWKGVFHSEEVAVKIFFSRDEPSWKREIEIYSTVMLKNENILPFIGSDVTSVNSCTQLWLVTAYFELGSLFDYLNNHTLKLNEMLSVMISIASGITHLHTEIFGTQGKPAIAHRDIKSKNILMKTQSTCCIADFGLAVTHKQTGSLNIAFNYRVGTKRYMAPEVLDGSLKENSLLSYTMADIYSFSLVMWEILRRSQSEYHHSLPYQVPYYNMVPNDPSFEDMRKIVCIDQQRPPIPAEFENHEILKSITNIIRETWLTNPTSRLSALRVKKSLIKLNM